MRSTGEAYIHGAAWPVLSTVIDAVNNAAIDVVALKEYGYMSRTTAEDTREIHRVVYNTIIDTVDVDPA